MNTEQALDVLHEALLVTLIISAPMMLIGMIVGTVISLIQAMTQIQETSLAFIPKMLALFIALSLFLPFMLGELAKFTENIMDRIVSIS
ncbi:MAG: flagellar biosynthesis protein FliQ [Proteobacteria bacterium]|nr:flagellar biosynthesis protein FliQ [Pseudomonadota bacterium]MBI3496794.1 flagellar biosynthesis protein FliQ [Pseudomonadota bacterium]